MRIITRRDTGLLTQWTFGSRAIDSNVLSFIAEAGITDQTTVLALNNLVIGLKSNSIYTKMKAVYPFVGGTATTHKFNLVNPLNTDAAYRLVFTGGWTHSSTGALPNGTNGYADTFLNTSTALTLNSHSFGIYSRTSSIAATRCYGNYNGAVFLQHNIQAANMFSGAAGVTFTANPSLVLMMGSRTASNLFTAYRAGVSLGTNAAVIASLPNLKFYLGARNDSGVASFFSNHELAFAFLGDGLSGSESATLFSLVQAFQTSLGRQIF
jgi:hypothetical protein